MDNLYVEELLQALKAPDETTRQAATEELWRNWFQQKGIHGTRMLVKSQTLMESGQVAEAEALLSEMIRDEPDFAEAWNRRAVLYFMQNRYREAIADCQQVLTLVPYHFGALHGLGLCYASIGDYSKAIKAFRQALEVQPYSLLNQRLILECTAKIS